MDAVGVIVGLVLVLSVVADMVNTLVTTSTSNRRWWLTQRSVSHLLGGDGRLVRRLRSEEARERILATFAPVSVLALLAVWVLQQVVGFGLIWWSIGGVDGQSNLWDAIDCSGVVYFTLGFG